VSLRAWRTAQFIEPGKPIQNAHIESFNARLSEECLNEQFSSRSRMRAARSKSGASNSIEKRPHSSLGNLSLRNSRRKQPTQGYSALARRSAS
jgi:putative transposase